MLVLMIPVLYVLYRVSSFDKLGKIFFGVLLWADILIVAYSWWQVADGERLLKSFLYAIPITIVLFYGVIKFLDFGIKICDFIIKKTSTSGFHK